MLSAILEFYGTFLFALSNFRILRNFPFCS
jgi:hypothetical protein